MKATTFALILLSILTGTCLTSCIDDDFTTNPSHVLAFSTDTVAFDTVFTTIGTSTRSFRIYNRNKKSLNISSIKLADAEHSGFHINVDGMSGDNFTNVEIRGKDSLYVFVEANIDPTNQDNPIFIVDSIVFVTNGVQQDVKLTAYGQDVIIKRGETFTTDTHLTDERPYLIYDSLVVAPGTTLQIEPGARLHFHHRASLLVQGKLQVEGSMEAPVQIRGDRLDRLFADLPYDNLGGQWGGIRFYPESFGNKISYAYVRGMTSGIVLDSCASEEPRLEIANSRIRNSSGNLITSVYSRLNCWNSELSDAGGAILSLTGGIADFTHCTLYGNTSEIPSIDLTGSHVYFRSCLLRSNGEDDDNFINTVWNGQPFFKATGEEHYYYDYRIGSDKSDAIGKGNPDFAIFPLDKDMYGNLRSTSVDIGAYQYIPQEIPEE